MLDAVHDEVIKRKQLRKQEGRQELTYVWRMGRILLGGQATLSSTFQLERTFSLLILNLEKRRFNLGEQQHGAEARIMIFLKNAAKIKEALEGNTFKTDVNARLKYTYKTLIPWDYCNESLTIDEETEESLLDETGDEVSQSHNWPSQSDSEGPSSKSQSNSGRTSSKSQSDSRRPSSKSQSDSRRPSSNTQGDHRSTSNTQGDHRSTSNSQGDHRSTSIEPVYSSDKSFVIPDDGSINIYDESHDIIPSGNGQKIDTIIDPVRYPF